MDYETHLHDFKQCFYKYKLEVEAREKNAGSTYSNSALYIKSKVSRIEWVDDSNCYMIENRL